MIITKLEAAHRQLTTAIRMYFDDDDLAAIHTLACVARELYEKHCEAQGVERMFEQIRAANPERTATELWNVLNGPRNFLKHPEASLDLNARLELDDEMNAAMLWVACYDCAMLCKEAQPPDVQAYNLWFLATRFPRGGGNEDSAQRADEILAGINNAYPGLRTASGSEQKRIGKEMVQAARKIQAAAELQRGADPAQHLSRKP